MTDQPDFAGVWWEEKTSIAKQNVLFSQSQESSSDNSQIIFETSRGSFPQMFCVWDHAVLHKSFASLFLLKAVRGKKFSVI